MKASLNNFQTQFNGLKPANRQPQIKMTKQPSCDSVSFGAGGDFCAMMNDNEGGLLEDIGDKIKAKIFYMTHPNKVDYEKAEKDFQKCVKKIKERPDNIANAREITALVYYNKLIDSKEHREAIYELLRIPKLQSKEELENTLIIWEKQYREKAKTK